MDIGIIGSGNMGGGLGRLWAMQGHHVMFTDARQPLKVDDLVREVGSHARSGTPQDAVRFADVLLLAVQWADVRDAVCALGPLNDKTLISCVNPFGPRGLEVGLTTSAAEEIARLAGGAQVVAAFNATFATILHSRAHLFGGNTPSVFFCGNDREAKSTAAELIRDADLQPVDAGPLESARYIEPLAMLMTELGESQNMGSEIALKLMDPARTTELVKSAGALARSFLGIFAGRNGPAAIESVLSEDFVAFVPYGPHPVRGRKAFEEWMRRFRSAFSDFRCDIDELIDDGMRVAVRWTWSGTQIGELLRVAPHNRNIVFSETHLLRISGGRIVEDHVSANVLDLLNQLGTPQSAAA